MLDPLSFWKILLLGAIQGAAELLPVSSSAHVVVTEKLLGLDPSSPEMTFILIMLHTGTMLAVCFYFGKRWQAEFKGWMRALIVASLCTGVLGLILKKVVEKIFLASIPGAEIEMLFGNLKLISAALFATSLLLLSQRWLKPSQAARNQITDRDSVWIGTIQGFCLPFRGFSRSGATITTGLLRGLNRQTAEDFSFFLALILTPPILLREWLRLKQATHLNEGISVDWLPLLTPGLLGLICSFVAGLLALRWLSSWLENGKWHYFGYYCLAFSGFVFALS